MKIGRAALLLSFILYSCGKQIYTSNGEMIYKTGKNIIGESLIDKETSSIKFFTKCISCHGKNGDRMRKKSIKFIDLSNPKYYAVPYNDTLFFRFLDKDLKSDGSLANIGVRWKMSEKDKNDLLEYLKSL